MEKEATPSTSGYQARARSPPRKRAGLNTSEIEKELYRLDCVYADSDSECSESEEELFYEKPGNSQLLEEVEERETALEEEIDDPQQRSDDDSDNDHMSIESFMLESDESVLEERERGRSLHRMDLRRRAGRSRGGESRSRGRKRRRISVHDRDDWEEGSNFDPSEYNFDQNNSGIKDSCELDENCKESEFFKLFVDDEVVELMVRETNLFYEQIAAERPPSDASRMRRWKQVDSDEMYVFLAITLLMPHMKKSRIVDYWSKDPFLSTPIFARYMSRDRYSLISRFLHFTDNTKRREREHDRIWKVRDILEMIRSRITQFFHPYQKVVVDESLILFRGRLIFKQYIKSKRHRFGIKIYVICDCKTGVVLDIIVYTGTDVDIPGNDPLGHSGSVVKKLMSPYLGSGHILYTDNFYTSPNLADYLHQNNTGLVGTVRANRKGMPKFPSKMNTGQVIRKKKGQKMTLKWKDRRDVHMLSTIHKGTMVDSGKKDHVTHEPVMKPDVVVDYTKNMRLVDKSDMQIGSIDCLRRSQKWYKKLFYHMVDISMLNAYNLYVLKTKKRKQLRKFAFVVIKQLLQLHGKENWRRPGRKMQSTEDRISPNDWVKQHYLAQLPSAGKRKVGQRACHVCYNSEKRVRVRKHVSTWCKTCDVALCYECFPEYHSNVTF